MDEQAHVNSYIVTRDMQVYRLGDYELEAAYFWDALIELRDAPQSFGVYGTNRLDAEIQPILIEAGLAVETGSGQRVLPSPAFQAYYDAMVAALPDLNMSDDKIWKVSP